MKLIYGLKLPSEIYEFSILQNNIQQFEEFHFYKLSPELYCYGFILENPDVTYVEINENLTSFAQYINDILHTANLESYLQNPMQILLFDWVQYIESNTELLKNEGKTEEEVEEIMKKFEIGEHIQFKIYLSNITSNFSKVIPDDSNVVKLY